MIRLDQQVLDRSTRLDEALATVPAVSLFRRTSSLAANPTTQGISLRAIAPSGAGRTLVTLDGVPLNDPFGGWVLWSQVAPESLENVDIVRGAGAGPYGAGALTGVIQLRERDWEGGALDASVGEDGGRRLAAATTLAHGRVSITGSALYDQSDGYTPVRGAAAGAADTPLSLLTKSAALRGDIALDDVTALSLRASAYDEERGSGLLNTESSSSGQAYSATVARTPSSDRIGWRAQVWRRESDFANSSARVLPGRTGTEPANDQYATPAIGWGVNAAVRGQADWRGRLEWEVGADARFSDGETRERFSYEPMRKAFNSNRIAGGETSVVGLYAEGSVTTGPWLLAGGLRADRWKNENGQRRETSLASGAVTLEQSFPDRSGEVVSARLAIRRDLGAHLAARVAAYTGFRPATLNELHRPFRVGADQTRANPDLEPEVLRGVETGLSWEGDATTLEATVFWNRIEDAIVNVTLSEDAGGVVRQRWNAGVIQAAGLELNGEHRLDRVTLFGAVSVTDAELDGGSVAPQLTGLRPAQAPVWSATAGIDWRASDRLTLSTRARYESRRFDDDLNSRVLDAALTADARIDWRLRDGVVLYAVADNLFDENVPVSLTGDGVEGYGSPRTLRAGFALTW